jgi:predicted phosphodiesterase
VTRLAILADIHGNFPALEAVLADLAAFPVDGVIVAGDLINWGPFSAAIVERALAEGWAVIRGNNEFYLLDYLTPQAPTEWADPAHYPMLPWLRQQLAGHLHTRIAAWPDTLSIRPPDAPPLRIVHGSARSNSEGIFPGIGVVELAPMLAGVPEGTIVAAHTHLPLDCWVGHWHLFNPGSVGVPLQGELIASYLLLDGDETGWRGTFRRVPFSNAAVYAEFARQKFVATCGIIGELVLAEFQTARLQVHPFLQWRQAICPDAPFDRETLTRFRQSDPLPYLPSAYRSAAADPAASTPPPATG